MVKQVFLPNGVELNFPDTMSPEDINKTIENEIAPQLGLQLPAAPTAPVEPSSIPRRIADHVIQLGGKGSLNAMKLASGAADLMSFGGIGAAKDYVRKFYRDLGIPTPPTEDEIDQYLTSLQTPEFRANIEEASQAATEAAKDKGVLSGLYAAGKEYVKRPEAIAALAEESLPSAIGAELAIGRTILPRYFPKLGALKRAGISEGVAGAAAMANQIRPEGEFLSPKQEAITIASGVLTGLQGAFGGKVAEKLKIIDPDVAIVTGKKSLPEAKNALVEATKSAFAESTFEELPQSMQEQIAQNLATGRPWDEGVVEAGAAGALAGFVTAGGITGVSQTLENRRAGKLPPSPVDTGKELGLPPGEDKDVVPDIGEPTTTKKKGNKAFIDSISQTSPELASTLSNLFLTKKTKKDEAEDEQFDATKFGASVQVSGQPKYGTPAGVSGTFGPGMVGSRTDFSATETGEGKQLGALEFDSEAAAKNYRRVNKYQQTHNIKVLPTGKFAVLPKESAPDTSMESLLARLLETPKQFTNPQQIRDFLDNELGTDVVEKLKKENKKIVYDLLSSYKEQQKAGIPDTTKANQLIDKLQDEGDLSDEQAQEEKEKQDKLQRANTNPIYATQLDYIKTGSPYGEQSPAELAGDDTNQARQIALEHAAFDAAMAEYELADIEGLNAELERLAQERKEAALAQRQARIDALIEKGYSEDGAVEEVGPASKYDYSINNPLAYMDKSEYFNKYKEFVGKKAPDVTHLANKKIRDEFINNLSAEENALYTKRVTDYAQTELLAIKTNAFNQANKGKTVSRKQKLEADLQTAKNKLFDAQEKGKTKNIAELTAKINEIQTNLDKAIADEQTALNKYQTKVQKPQVKVEKTPTQTINDLEQQAEDIREVIDSNQEKIAVLKKNRKLSAKSKEADINKLQSEINVYRSRLNQTVTKLEEARKTEKVTGPATRYQNVAEEPAVEEMTLEEKMEQEEQKADAFFEKYVTDSKAEKEKLAKKKGVNKKLGFDAIITRPVMKLIASAPNVNGLISADTILDMIAGTKKSKDFMYQHTAKYLAQFMRSVNGNVKIVFGTVPNGRGGQFDPATNTITIDKQNLGKRDLGSAVVHEVTHYALDHVIDNPQLLKTPEQKAAFARLQELHKHAIQYMGEQYADLPLKEFLSETMSLGSFTYALGSKVPPLQAALDYISDLARTITQVLGLSRFIGNQPTVLQEVLNNINSILMGQEYPLPAEGFRGKDISNLPEETEDNPESTDEFQEIMNKQEDIPKFKPTVIMDEIKKFFLSLNQDKITKITTNLQNSRFPLKNLENQLRDSGRLIVYGVDFNNAYTMITRAFGIAQMNVKKSVHEPSRKLHEAISSFADAKGIDINEAYKILKLYAIGLHAPERRRVKYLLYVPLKPEAATKRQEILDIISGEDITKLDAKDRKATAEFLMKELQKIVNKNRLSGKAGGISSANYTTINEAAAEYNVIEGLTFSQEELLKQKYEAETAEIRELVDNVFNSSKEMNNIARELNREAGFWSKATDAVTEFYGWKNYFPFKLKKGQKEISSKTQFQIDIEDVHLGKDSKDYLGPRISGSEYASENPFLQSIVEATIAASRTGGAPVTRAVKHLVEQKMIKGQVLRNPLNNPQGKKTNDKPYYSFSDRYNSRVDDRLLKQANVIYSYNEDGSMDLIQIDDIRMLEAIRRTYDDTSNNALINGLNFLTSLQGQYHTRFNLGFAPYNYVRDVLTNTLIASYDLDVKTAATIAANASSQLVIIPDKIAKIAWAFQKNDIKAIDKIVADDKSGIAKDLQEFLVNGNSVSVITGLNALGTVQKLMKESEAQGAIPLKDVTDFFDGYMSFFELGARLAAYRAIRQFKYEQFLADPNTPALATKNNMSLEQYAMQAAIIDAGAFTKNLANFEEVGRYGRVLGGLYMFFRAGATGAARAFDSLSPAFRSWNAIKNTLPQGVLDDPVAVARAEKEHNRQQVRARIITGVLVGAGMGLYALSHAGAGDDDEGRNIIDTDDMSRWTRNLRFYVGKDPDTGKELMAQMPWGFGPGAFLAMGAQLGALATSPYVSLANITPNLINIALDSFLPLPISRINPLQSPALWLFDSLMPSEVKPLFENVVNTDGLGKDIRNEMSRYSSPYTSGRNVPEVIVDATREIYKMSGGEIEIDPATTYFILNSYFDGITKIAQDGYNGLLTIMGSRNFDIERDLFPIDKFLSTKGDLDARTFEEARVVIEKNRPKLKTIEAIQDPDILSNYYDKHANEIVAQQIYDEEVNAKLKPLQTEKKDIELNSAYDRKTRTELLKDNKMEQDAVKKLILMELEPYLADKVPNLSSKP
jgi:hypothetical protein